MNQTNKNVAKETSPETFTTDFDKWFVGLLCRERSEIEMDGGKMETLYLRTRKERNKNQDNKRKSR